METLRFQTFFIIINFPGVCLLSRLIVTNQSSEHMLRALACPGQAMIGIRLTSLNVSILIAVLLRLSMGSSSHVALTEAKIRMSEEGTLIYGSLSSGEKSQLFMDYMREFDREVRGFCESNFTSAD